MFFKVLIPTLVLGFAFASGATATTPEKVQQVADIARLRAPCVELQTGIGYIFTVGEKSFRISYQLTKADTSPSAPPIGTQLQITLWTKAIEEQITSKDLKKRKAPEDIIPDFADTDLTGTNYNPATQREYDAVIDEILDLKAQCENPPPPPSSPMLVANG